MMITSVTNEKIKDLIKLNAKKTRDETGTFLVEGWHMVEEAIACGLCREVITSNPDYQSFPLVTVVSEAVMNKISGVNTPQGIMALCNQPKETPIGDKILLLDGVADPGNMGSLLRSALAFGFTTVFTEDCVDVTNPKVLRSTQGAFFRLNILAGTMASFLKKYPDYHFFGTNLHGGIPLSSLSNVPKKIGLILGNEANGVREEILSLTEKNLFIEISGIESLNVAVAGGILMHALQ
jgi:TrmH family RNA methyltransferase